MASIEIREFVYNFETRLLVEDIINLCSSSLSWRISSYYRESIIKILGLTVKLIQDSNRYDIVDVFEIIQELNYQALAGWENATNRKKIVSCLKAHYLPAANKIIDEMNHKQIMSQYWADRCSGELRRRA